MPRGYYVKIGNVYYREEYKDGRVIRRDYVGFTKTDVERFKKAWKGIKLTEKNRRRGKE